MHQLPDEVAHEFRQGNFVVKGSDNCFNQVDPDHSLEWLNGVGKKAGGIIGITKTALSRWTLSYIMRACVASQTKEMFNIHIDDDLTPTESTPGRMRRDNLDDNRIVEVLKRFKAFEMGQTSGQLVKIVTKDVATSDIQESLINSEKLGQQQLSEFVSKRLVDRSVS